MGSARPNILYLHSHDSGRYVQPYGYPVAMPNLQAFAEQAVLFRNAFCVASTCSGSRAGLLTGQHTPTNGMMGLAHRGWSLHDYNQHILHRLREVGYWSALLGEQHISEDPNIIGYDHVVDIREPLVQVIAPHAIDLLKNVPQPFFMSVGYFETHRVFFEPGDERDERYSNPIARIPDTPETRRDVAALKASAYSLDDGIGRVLRALEENGLAENTLVVITTDHGLPFPLAKATLTDRGTGVMLMMRGPGGFNGGRVLDQIVTHLDLYPTWCEVAGAPMPDNLHGRSLLPLVKGELDELHEEVFSALTYHVAYDPNRSVRTKRWRYIRKFDDYPHPVLCNTDDSPSKSVLLEHGWGEQQVPRERLYDMVLDPEETINLAGDDAYAAVLDDMRRRVDRWMHEIGDPLLEGPVAPPPGARINEQHQVSPDDPVTLIPESAATS